MKASCKIAVVGAGFAGIAAAAALLERGATPIVFSRFGGASFLGSGAFDYFPWAQIGFDTQTTPELERALALLEQMGLCAPQPRATMVATMAGMVRPTRAVGTGVLDLGAHAGREIAVVDVGRDDWNAKALSRSLNSSSWAEQTKTRFSVLDLVDAFTREEIARPLAAFGRLLETPQRAGAFHLRLSEALGARAEATAVLCGPWLGSQLDFPDSRTSVGEALSPPEGSFGERTRQAFSTWLEGQPFEVERCMVDALVPDEKGVKVVSIRDAGSRKDSHFVDGVIVATGGLVGGGVGLSASAPHAGLVTLLDPAEPPLGGSSEGWDARDRGGSWVHPPHGAPPLVMEPRLEIAGDARREGGEGTPGGTVLSAMVSAERAVARLLDRLSQPLENAQ